MTENQSNNGNGNGNGNSAVEQTPEEKAMAIAARTDYPFAFACPNDCFEGAGHGRIMVLIGDDPLPSRPFTSVEDAMTIVNNGRETGKIVEGDVEKLTREINAIPNLAQTEAEFFASQPEQQEDEEGPINALLAALTGGGMRGRVIRL